jgi:putative DNA primase/helicase
LFAAANALVHVPKYAEGDETGLILHTPRFFNLSAAEYIVDRFEPPPAEWLAFLNRLWPDDPDSIALLQEWFGYLLLPDNHQQKMLLLLGPPRSGKGTTLDVIKALLGPSGYHTFDLHELDDKFAYQPFVGKLAAIVDDAKLSNDPRINWGTVAGKLKTVSGSMDMRHGVNRKNKAHEQLFVPVRFVMAANDIPAIPDTSGALAERYCILRYWESYLGREDVTLSARLLLELPGIFNWAVAGWKRLREQGRFTAPVSAEADREELRADTSPIAQFVRERCVVGRDHHVPKSELFAAWERWYRSQDFPAPFPAKRSFKGLLGKVPGVRLDEYKPFDKSLGRQIEHYTGIALKPVDDPDDDRLPFELAGQSQSHLSRLARSAPDLPLDN